MRDVCVRDVCEDVRDVCMCVYVCVRDVCV